MFLLLMIPVVIVVAAVHRVLQMYAPSNVLAARVRRERPHLGTALRLGAMSAGLVVCAHLLATWAATGDPVG